MTCGEILLHATCIRWSGAAMLLRGGSGAGKSDLALRMLDQGATLVADDQVLVSAADGKLFARPPEALAGLLEVRGIGIIRVRHEAPARIGLVVDLVEEGGMERMPEPAGAALLGCVLPRFSLVARHASAAAKLRLAVRQASGLVTPIE